MELFVIDGGKPLYGSVGTQGSKNSILPIMAAALLSEEGCRLENCPRLSDVETALAILRLLGCRGKLRGHALELDCSRAAFAAVPTALAGKMRASILFLGPLLARFGRAELPLPGGCRLGPRPIDLHLAALRQLGAEIAVEEGRLLCHAEKLRGAEICFPSPSVGATENALMAAAAAEGESLLLGCAREPEIVDLAAFLCAMGARIRGAGTDRIYVEGVSRFHAARHRIIPDRIAAATTLCAAAACGGEVELGNCDPVALAPVLRSLGEMGCTLIIDGDRICLSRRGALKAPAPIRTGPWPAFPTDAQPPLLAASLRAEGESFFEETVFSARFAYAAELKALGARLRVSGQSSRVKGVPVLRGGELRALDLRGGAALLIGALQAEGVSRLWGAEYIDRGYEAPEQTLTALGARIQRKEGRPTEQQSEQTPPEKEHRAPGDPQSDRPGSDRGGYRIIF